MKTKHPVEFTYEQVGFIRHIMSEFGDHFEEECEDLRAVLDKSEESVFKEDDKDKILSEGIARHRKKEGEEEKGIKIHWDTYKCDRYKALVAGIQDKAKTADAFLVELLPCDRELHKKLKEDLSNSYVSEVYIFLGENPIGFVVAKNGEACTLFVKARGYQDYRGSYVYKNEEGRKIW